MSTSHRGTSKTTKTKYVFAGAAVLVVAIAATAYTTHQIDDRNAERASTTAEAAATTVAPATSSEPQSPETTAALLRAAFLAQAGAERGYETYYGGPQNITGIASDTCARIDADPTTDTVWDIAGNLEDGPFEFPVAAAWDMVDLVSTVYCPQHHALVIETIGEATS